MHTLEVWFQDIMRIHQQGNLDQAAQAYESIIREQPNHPDANHLLGLILHSRGQINLAIRATNRDFLESKKRFVTKIFNRVK